MFKISKTSRLVMSNPSYEQVMIKSLNHDFQFCERTIVMIKGALSGFISSLFRSPKSFEKVSKGPISKNLKFSN